MNQKYQLSPDVLSQEVHGETVLLDLAGETYFGLNEVGTRIWQLLKQDHGFEDMVAVLEQEFDVSRERLQADVSRLMEDLISAGVIKPVSPSRQR